MAGINERDEQSLPQLNLSSLAPAPGSRRKRKRLGIGEGSGHGKTAGKGHKGQNARSGPKWNPGFEGGQMPLNRRLPKIGFVSRKKLRRENVFSLVSTKQLLELGVEGEISLELLKEKGLIASRSRRVKVLGGHVIDRRIIVEAHAASRSAKEAIESAGGSVRIVS